MVEPGGRSDQVDSSIERRRAVRVGIWLTALLGAYLLSIPVAPLTLPEGTVPALSGRANILDYASEDGWGSWGNQHDDYRGAPAHDHEAHEHFAWSELGLYHATVYAIGDLNCHQRSERSWTLGGNQLPVDARVSGIVLGGTIAGLTWLALGGNRWTTTDTFLSIVPLRISEPAYRRGYRSRLAWLTGLGLTLPLALDGGIQLVTSYESSNVKRLVTGVLFGFGVLWWFAANLTARPRDYSGGAAEVELPAGARLVPLSGDAADVPTAQAQVHDAPAAQRPQGGGRAL